MNSSNLTFIVYVIHQLADTWGQPPAKVYDTLTRTGVMKDYLIPYYDVLHTLGREYLVDDISGMVLERGGLQ